MGGNDKADALVEVETKKWSVQRNFLLDPAKSPRSIFYDISRAGMHPGGTGKSQGVAKRR
jgi:hypothetical protein